LADNLGAAAARDSTLHPGGSLVKQRSRSGHAGALEAGALGRDGTVNLVACLVAGRIARLLVVR
jgi:hypothetical protein